MTADRRRCWKCGDTLTIATIRWGRDTKPTEWFVHRSTGTPNCLKETNADIL